MLSFWLHWTVTDNIHWSSLQLSEMWLGWWIAQSRLEGRIQVEEFRYLEVSFMSDCKNGKIDQHLGALAVVMQTLYQTAAVKTEPSYKAKLSI